MAKAVHIKNKRASFEYFIIESYTAGIQLMGTEIKSIREGKVSLADSYCMFRDDELFVLNMHIAEYRMGTHYNHEPKRERKLLLTKRELRKLSGKIKEKGFTIIPTELYINDQGFVKLDIALARGKHYFDKRESIKKKDIKREMDRRGNY